MNKKKGPQKRKRVGKMSFQAPYKPKRGHKKTVESMTSFGIPQDQICLVLDISKPTLHKYFRREIDTGTIKANAAVASNLFRKATSSAAGCTAEIWWLKVRAGWKEPAVEHKHSGAIGSYDLSKLTDEQLAKLEAILGQAAIVGADPSRESETEG